MRKPLWLWSQWGTSPRCLMLMLSLRRTWSVPRWRVWKIQVLQKKVSVSIVIVLFVITWVCIYHRYVRHSWQKWKHYLSLEYKFRYCPSITLKLHLCLYIIVNHNYPSFSLWEDFAFVMNLISYVLYLSSK